MSTVDEWKIKIEEFKQSGMSQVQWAKTKGIKYHLLKYWFYRLRDLEQKKEACNPVFKELKPAPCSYIKIKWRNITFELESDFNEVILKRFLKALEQSCYLFPVMQKFMFV